MFKISPEIFLGRSTSSMSVEMTGEEGQSLLFIYWPDGS